VAEITPPSSSSASTTAASASSSPSFYYIRADRAQFPLQKLIPGKEHSEQIAHQLQQLLPQQQQQLMEQTMLRQQQQQQQLFLIQNQQNALGHLTLQKQYQNELCHLQSQSSTLPSITGVADNCMAYVSPTLPDMTKSQTFYFAEDFLLSHKENSAYIQFLPESQSPLTSSQLSFPVSVLAPASSRQPEANSLPASASSHHSFPVSLPAPASSHHSFPVSLPANSSSHHPSACTQIQYVPCYFYYPVPVPYAAASAAASSAIQLPPALAAAFSLEQNDGSELSSRSSAVQGCALRFLCCVDERWWKST
jgi:hypothetical protein